MISVAGIFRSLQKAYNKYISHKEKFSDNNSLYSSSSSLSEQDLDYLIENHNYDFDSMSTVTTGTTLSLIGTETTVDFATGEIKRSASVKNSAGQEKTITESVISTGVIPTEETPHLVAEKYGETYFGFGLVRPDDMLMFAAEVIVVNSVTSGGESSFSKAFADPATWY